ncbi:MAG: GNAT family N-acetyltransferase [Verrucomicrobiota bacterium]
MRHDLHLNGCAYRLRPVGVEDAELIIELRGGEGQRARFLHPISPDPALQREWITRYLARENDYYWVVERLDGKRSEGLIGIYDLKPERQAAEWGRWILRPDSLAAAESALLVYRAAFENLQLNSLYCLTIADNLPVVSFHDSCGLPRVEVLKQHLTLGEQKFDAVKHLCTLENWPVLRSRLEPQAQLIARRLQRQK